MSSVDNRVVQMEFKNSQFESGAKATLNTLDRLKKALRLDNASKGFEEVDKASKKLSFSPLEKAIDLVNSRFSTMGIIGVSALNNITNSAINAGKQLVSALTIDPIKTGFQEYETQINAVQTILANTSSKGTNLQQVNKALDELNHYADMTIYNFTEMTRNIGTFTAAGVDLDTSVSAIKGIANLAAVSGSTSQQASTAMYQLSQALAAGTVKLMDWNSVVNAGMGGQVFQDALKDTARVHGIAIDQMIEDEGSFRETLSKGWLSSEILTETLAKFTGDLTEAQLQSMGYTDEQIKGIMEMGKTANDAATKVKTFTQLFDTLKEAAQSGWTQTWEILIGDFEEAKELLTGISDTVSDFLNKSAEARNNVLQGWKDLGGRTVLLDSFKNIFDSIVKVTKAIGDAFKEIFPPMTSEKLMELTNGFKELTERFQITDEMAEKIKVTFKGLFSILKVVVDIVLSVAKVFGSLLSLLFPIGNAALTITSAFGQMITNLTGAISSLNIFDKIVSTVTNGILNFSNNLAHLIDNLDMTKIVNSISNVFGKVFDIINKFLVEGLNIDGLVKTFNTAFSTGIFAFIAAQAAKFSKNLSGSMGAVKDLIEGLGEEKDKGSKISEMLDSVKESLKSFQQSLQASTLLKIATAIGILAIALNTLSKISVGGLAKSLTAMSVMFAELFIVFSQFVKIVSVSDLKGIASASISMVALATAILILSAAVKNMSNIEWDGLAKGLLGVGVALVELAAFTKLANFKGLTTASIGFIAIASAILILSGAVSVFAKLNIKEMIKGLSAVAILLTEITIFSKSIGKLSNIVAGASLIAVAAGLTALGIALSIYGGMSLSSIGKGMLVIGGSLAILAAGLRAMKGTGAGSVALIAAASALLILAPALRILGGMSLTQLAIGLTAIAGAFAVVGGSAYLLQGLTPTILALSVAIGIFGAACLAVGAGMLAFSAGLASLAVSGAAGAAALVVVLQSLISLIPALFTALVRGLISAMDELANAGQSITNFVTTIITSICEAIRNSAAQIVTTITYVISLLLNELLGRVPEFVDTGMKIIQGVLEGIANNIQGVTEAAILVATNFINGIASQLPALIQAGMDLITAFLTGLADAIDSNGSKINNAVIRLFTSLFGAFALIAGALFVVQKAQTTILLMTAVLAAIALIIKKLAELPVESVLGIAASLSTLLISLSTAAAILQFVRPAAALTGVVGLAAVIAGLTVLFTAIGAINGLVPEIKMFVDNAVPLLQSLGNALGAFFGGIIGGVIESASAGLVGLGTNLSQFMFELEPFLNGVKNIDDSVISGIQTLALMVVSLAAADFINGINIFGSQGSSIQSLAENLPLLGKAMNEFASTIDESNAGKIQASVEAAKALAEMLAVLPREGGVFSFFTGEVDFEGLSDNLPKFGEALKAYGEAVSGLDSASINSSIEGAQGIVDVASSIEKSGGLVQAFTGQVDFAGFSENLPKFGEALKSYGESVSGLDSASINSSIEGAQGIVDIANSIGTSGGLFSMFTGSNDLGDFADKLPKFGEALKSFGDSVKGINTSSIRTAVYAAKSLVEIEKSLPESGGLFSNDQTLNDLASRLPKLGFALKSYGESVSGLNPGSISTSVNAIKMLAKITTEIPDWGGFLGFFTGSSGNVEEFARQLPKLGNALTAYSDSVSGLNTGNIYTSIYAIQALSDISKELPSWGGLLGFLTGESGNIAAFGNQLPVLGKGIKAFSESVSGIDTGAIYSAVYAAQELGLLSNYIPNWGGLFGLLNGETGKIAIFAVQLPALGLAIRAFAESVSGMDASAIYSAVYAAKQLGLLSVYIPSWGGLLGFLNGETGKIAVFAVQLPILGDAIRAFADSVSGMDTSSLDAALHAGMQLAAISGIIPSWGGLFGLLNGQTGNIAVFASQLPIFGKGIRAFADSVAGMDTSAIYAAVYAAQQLALLSEWIPSWGGLLGFITGEAGKMAVFASQLPIFGQGIKAFGESVKGIDSSSIMIAVQAGTQLAQLSTIVPNWSGLLGFLTGEAGKLEAFGTQLPKLGEGIKAFSDSVSGGIDIGSIMVAVQAGQQLAALAAQIPSYNAIADFFLGDKITAFKEGIPKIGEGIKAFGDSVAELNPSMIDTAILAGQRLVGLITLLNSTGYEQVQPYSVASATLANSLNYFATQVATIDYGAIESAIYWLGQIKNAMQEFPGEIDSSVLSSFVETVNNAGKQTVETFVNTLNEGKSQASDAARNMINQALISASAAMTVGNSRFMNGGRLWITNLAKGMEGGRQQVLSALTSILDECVRKINDYQNRFTEAGRNIPKGVAQGIDANKSEAINAAVRMAQESLNAAKRELDIRSPSRRFADELGKYIPMGVAEGILKYMYYATKASSTMADGTFDAMSKTLDSISFEFDEMNLEPTITPVLDMSQVEQGISRFGTEYRIPLSASSDSLRTSISKLDRQAELRSINQNGSSQTIINKTYDMTQNNYSPKPLSRIDIYRQTNNQFSRLKQIDK